MCPPPPGNAPTFSARPSTLRPIETEPEDLDVEDQFNGRDHLDVADLDLADLDGDDPDVISTENADLSDRSGFLRVGSPTAEIQGVGDGPRWQPDEADDQAHRFLEVLAGGRETSWRDDPIEHARENSLLLLFGDVELAAFETLLARMPRARAREWRDLLSGGARSEAFGPLTLQERLDERQVEDALVQGRRQRAINLVIAGVVVAVVIAAAVAGYRALTSEDQRTQGALRFDPITTETGSAVAGGSPVAAEELTASLSILVAVAPGEGPAEDRIVTAPFSALPQPPGAVRASVFDYGGSGQIAVVGPEGWLLAPTCLRASVVSADLRALDTVTWESAAGACAETIGRVASPVCVGESAVLLDVRIPTGEVPLPEGGVAFADAIRVQLVAEPTDEYEMLSVRGLISVPADSDVIIPRFGGASGDEITFALGADRSGTCTIGAAGV